MFRKPMRLEKWIAYDGVSLGEMVSGLQEGQHSGSDGIAEHEKLQHIIESEDLLRTTCERANFQGDIAEKINIEKDSLVEINCMLTEFSDGVPLATIHFNLPEKLFFEGKMSITFPMLSEVAVYPDDASVFLPFFHNNLLAFILPDGLDQMGMSGFYLSVSATDNGIFSLFSTETALSDFIVDNGIEVGEQIAVSPWPAPDEGLTTGSVWL